MEVYKQKRVKHDEQDKLKEKKENQNEDDNEPNIGPRSKVSLLDQHSELKKKAEGMCVCVCIVSCKLKYLLVRASHG